jgi:linoleoyl-CoA desaturase
VFQLAHTVEETSHPLPNENGIIENDWAIHQLNTTVNFSRNNKLLSWYVGGLNFQVEHHLFPRICHVHYPEIAPIVKQTAEEFGIPYLEQQYFSKALKSHFAALERFGRLPHPDEIFA